MKKIVPDKVACKKRTLREAEIGGRVSPRRSGGSPAAELRWREEDGGGGEGAHRSWYVGSTKAARWVLRAKIIEFILKFEAHQQGSNIPVLNVHFVLIVNVSPQVLS
ncbi:envelope glycoprotein gp160 [Striga asiatica]|uniref:Envelope glycoprotein gp160 n=1 Tax=Striga asiatica TaxID=4170 RepID=A0A5A7Q8E1_STRAF|nr:envelope glycoprotein gp160 [Striga asiatica]